MSDPRTVQKKYWTALKKITKQQVSTIIPPIFHNGSYITDISEKWVIFNNYFKNQCTLVETTSTLPTLIKSTNLSLKEVNFTMEDITNHINKLNVNKEHGHDGLSSRILNICSDYISKPMYIIFFIFLTKGYFPKK